MNKQEWYIDFFMSEYDNCPVNSYGPNTLEECLAIVRTVINENDTTEKSYIVKVEITTKTKGCNPMPS